MTLPLLEDEPRKLDAVIIGAGVTGLSIGLELVKRGYKIAFVAKDLPEDDQSPGFASPWAGCNWCSFADNNKREQEWDRKTYEALFRVAKEYPNLCELIQFHSYESESLPEPWFKDLVKDYSISNKGTKAGERCVSYKSFIMHAPNYLRHLAQTLRSAGVPIVRKRLTSLEEAYDLPAFGPVGLVINATGIGAKVLLGNKDRNDIYPIRGQTVLVKAPGVKTCYMMASDHPDEKTNKDTEISEPTYIIPRPGPEGHVVLGGSFQVNNWVYVPDYALAERILKKNYELCPALAGPNGKSWRDIEIVSHNVGFRPSREGGCRLDLEDFELGGNREGMQLAPKSNITTPRKAAILHAYGIGPAGFQASLGYALEAGDMVDAHFKKDKRSSKL